MTLDAQPLPPLSSPAPSRIQSIDVLRALVMLTMIFVNDLDEDQSPWWLQHFHGKNGLTFVDLVFPAFIFIVGLSIPLAFAARLRRGESLLTLAGHVLLRTISLLAIGIMMVNAESGASFAAMGKSAHIWEGAMFLAAIFAFCSINPRSKEPAYRIVTWTLRAIGLATLLYLAVIFRGGKHGTVQILHFHPFWLRTSWYGILGLIGWAYLVASIIYALFGTRRLPILTAIALLFTLFALDKNGAFDQPHWLSFISIGEDFGTHAAIAVGGLLLGTILLTPDTTTHAQRLHFALWAAIGFAIAALVIAPPLPLFKQNPPLWGISKNAATPAWGLWACAATSLLFAACYLICDVWNFKTLTKPIAIAGQNVLLAYLLSEGLESWLNWLHLGNWYDNLAEPNLTHAILRSLGCGIVLLILTALLNRIGFWVRL